jgi:hypothetical protein
MNTTDDQIITRYLTLSKFIDLLTNNRLFLPSLQHLKKSEKLEGTRTSLKKFFDDGTDEMLNHFVNKVFPCLFASNPRDQDINQIKSKPESKNYQTPFTNLNFNGNKFEDFQKVLNESYFISCWHASEDENMAMWKIYGQEDSVRVKTTVKILKDMLSSDLYTLVVKKVDYNYKGASENGGSIECSTSDECEDLVRIFQKHKAFQYEQEIRYVAYDKNKDFTTTKDPDNGIYLKVDIKTLIKDVRLPPNCSTLFKEIITNLTTQYLEIEPSQSTYDYED